MIDTGHRAVIELALRAMPAEHKPFWDAIRPGMIESYAWPDRHAIALLRGETGPWRACFPRKLLQYNFELGARTARAFFPKTAFYARNMLRCLRRGDMQGAGRFAGVFSHYVADFAEPAHYYELDIGRLAPPPPDMANCEYHRTIEDIDCTIETMRYTPRLLGVTLEEILFRIEARYTALHALSVASVLPMLQAIYRRRNDQAARTFNRVVKMAAAVYADFCHTIRALAVRDFPRRATTPLQDFDLRTTEPWRYDVEFNFGNRPLIDAITRTIYGHAEPLRLPAANKKPSPPIPGICVIPHALPLPETEPEAWLQYRLPRGVFARFETSTGLLAGCKRQAASTFSVLLDGQPVAASGRMQPGDPARTLSVAIGNGRDLVLKVRTDGSTDRLAYAIWGAPRLLKR